MALLRGATILPLSNGLPANVDPIPRGGRYALTTGRLAICIDLQSCVGGTLPRTATLIEYHNAMLDHYFMTLSGPEAVGIENGAAGPGWRPCSISAGRRQSATANSDFEYTESRSKSCGPTRCGCPVRMEGKRSRLGRRSGICRENWHRCRKSNTHALLAATTPDR